MSKTNVLPVILLCLIPKLVAAQQCRGNCVDGIGTTTLSDGMTVSGRFVNSIVTGPAKVTWPDGAYFTGTFVDGQPGGPGTLVQANGKTFSGTYVKGYLAGRVTVSQPDGLTYVGELDKDKNFSGRGTLTLQDKTRVVGNFKAGMYEGSAIISMPSGDVIKGNFHNHQLVVGIYEFAGGSTYEGQFANGFFDGKGAFKYRPGDNRVSYVGDFHSGLREGLGTVLYRDGRKYVGEFKADKPVRGRGAQYAASGQKTLDETLEEDDADEAFAAAAGRAGRAMWLQWQEDVARNVNRER